MARPVFKTAMEGPNGSPVGSIPTRSRQHFVAVLMMLVFVAAGAGSLAAQTPPPPPPIPPVVVAPGSQVTLVKVPEPDSLNPTALPVPPLKAFFMSLAIPGWSQARLDRKLTGAIFVSIEGLSLGMTMKTIREIKYFTRVNADSARIAGLRSQRQDWLILLGFNHLFAGLEGFVATQLHDFPADVKFRLVPLPNGGIGARASVPFRFR